MKKKVTATLAAAATAVAIGAGAYLAPAQAYPPGKHLTVTATDPTSLKPFTFTVTVAQGLPGARVRVGVYRKKGGKKLGEIVGVLGPDGTLTVPFTLDLKDPDDIKSLRVRAVVLSKTNFEKAATTVVINGRGITLPKNGYVGEAFNTTATGFAPNAPIQLVAVRGKQRVVIDGTTNASGKFTGSFTLPDKGRWTIVATSGGKSVKGDVKVLQDHSDD